MMPINAYPNRFQNEKWIYNRRNIQRKKKLKKNRKTKTNACSIQSTVWFISFLVSSSLCYWQVFICCDKFFAEPTGTNVIIDTFDVYKIPAITLCPATYNFNYNFLPAFERKCENDKKCQNMSKEQRSNYSFSNMNTSLLDMWTLWENVSFDATSACKFAVNISECSKSDWMSISDIDTVAGRCKTFDSHTLWYYGGKLWVWWITVANIKQLPAEYGPVHLMGDLHTSKSANQKFISRVFFDDDANNQIETIITDFKYLNIKRNPCITYERYIQCINNCTNLHVQNVKTECRWPFIESKLAYCDTLAEVLRSSENIFKLQFSNVTCSCGRPCNSTKFLLMVLMSKNEWPDTTVIAITLPSNTKQIVTEFLLYPFSSLVSELGGSIGLFLGISLHSILNSLHSFVHKLFASKQNRLNSWSYYK